MFLMIMLQCDIVFHFHPTNYILNVKLNIFGWQLSDRGFFPISPNDKNRDHLVVNPIHKRE